MEIIITIRKLSKILYFDAYLINCTQNQKSNKHIMANHSSSQRLPDWLMLVIFLAIISVLFFFGDTFIFVVGLFIMIGIFANGYNNNPANHEHH